MVEYTELFKQMAIDNIGNFSANLGGTEMLKPLKRAFETEVEAGAHKRVFLLTDGHVSDRDLVLNLIKKHCENNLNTKVFSFGITDGCDKELVVKSAQNGNGAHQVIGDNEMSIIKEAVMKSLRRAGVPAMQDCSFDFGNGQQQGFRDGELYIGHMRQLGTLYQSEIVRLFSIMTEEEF
jgi:hypothetical protein